MELVVNGERRDMDCDATLTSLLAILRQDVRQIAVEVNGELVPRDNHQRTQLNDGDEIEIVGFVGGG